MSEPLADRFWAKVDRSGGPDACWLWTASRDPQGYGRIQIGRRSAKASWVALELDGRPKTPGSYACHTCDVKACVNPRHLYVGSAATNRRDAIERGLMRFPPQKGEANHRAKLTNDVIVAIRALAARGMVARRIGEQYGIHPNYVSQIVRRARWTHV